MTHLTRVTTAALAVLPWLLAPLAIHLAVTDRLLLRWACGGLLAASLLCALVCWCCCVVAARYDRVQR